MLSEISQPQKGEYSMIPFPWITQNRPVHRHGAYTGCQGLGGGGDYTAEWLFNDCADCIWDYETVLEMNSGNGHTALWMFLTEKWIKW